MKFPNYLKKNLTKPVVLTVLSTFIILVGVLVYFFIYRSAYVIAGALTLTGIFELIFLLVYRKGIKKVTNHVTSELEVVNDSIEQLSKTEFKPINTKLSINEIESLRNYVNETIKAFEHRNYSAVETTLNLEDADFVRADILTFNSFQTNLNKLIAKQYLYHSAVIAVQMIGSEKPEYLYELVNRAKEVLKPTMIGEFDHETILLYISSVTNTSILISELRTLLSEYHITEILRDGSQILYSCKAGVAIYPYSSSERIINDAVEALDSTRNVGVQDYGLFEPSNDAVLDAQERYRRSILYLEAINKNLVRCVTFKDLSREIQNSVKLYCNMMGFDNGGIMLVQDSGRRLVPWFEHSTSPDTSGFITYDSLQISRLNEYLNLFDSSASLFGNTVENLPFSVRSVFYNLSIERYYHFKMTKGPTLKGIIYFNNVSEQPPFTIIDREIMLCAADIIFAMVDMYMSAKDVERQELILSTLLKRDEKYVYGINNKTNELTYVSTGLAKIYPNARRGVKCYNIFNTQGNRVCDYCPLKVGNGLAFLPKLGEEIMVSTLAALPTEENEVLILLENNEARKRLDATFYDPLLHIYNDVKLKSDYERELTTKGMGYIFFIDIHEFEHWIPMFEVDGERKILQELLRRFEVLDFQDEVYRYNKTTLALILKRYTRKEVLTLVENIFNKMIEPMTGDKDTFRIEFHASLIPYPGDILDIEQFDSAVSTTLEDAKNIGLNNLYIYGEKDVRKLNREDYILDIIKDAIAKDKFEVFLQPILRISDRKPIGAEALLRLNDPARGYIPPSEFVPIAVKNNMMFEIEQYIIDSIGELWKAHGYEIFQQIGVTNISINISSNSITNPDFIARVSALLNKHRFPSGFLKFEVNEGVVVDNLQTVRNVMLILKEKGVSWAIDNYGMSVQSNKVFQDLAVDQLKVDRTCIMDIERSQRSKVALSYIVDFAKESKFGLVAEGVETEGQFSILKDMNFDEAQGYLFAKPIPIREYLKYLNFNAKN